MKSIKCGAFDSMTNLVYLDRNNQVFTETELDAFFTLHPEAKNTEFQSVALCGICLLKLPK